MRNCSLSIQFVFKSAQSGRLPFGDFQIYRPDNIADNFINQKSHISSIPGSNRDFLIRKMVRPQFLAIFLQNRVKL